MFRKENNQLAFIIQLFFILKRVSIYLGYTFIYGLMCDPFKNV